MTDKRIEAADFARVLAEFSIHVDMMGHANITGQDAQDTIMEALRRCAAVATDIEKQEMIEALQYALPLVKAMRVQAVENMVSKILAKHGGV